MEFVEDELDQLQAAEPAAYRRKLSRLRKVDIANAGNVSPGAAQRSPKRKRSASLSGKAASPVRSLSDGGDCQGREHAGSPEPSAHKQASSAGLSAATGTARSCDVWDEEDEMEQYFAQQPAGVGKPVKGQSSSGADRDGSGSEAESESQEQEPSQLDSDQLHAATQRILRESASNDRIGRGHNPEIAPLSGVLEKIRHRNVTAITRAPKGQSRMSGGLDPACLADAAEDLVVLSDDDELALDAAAQCCLPGGTCSTPRLPCPHPTDNNPWAPARMDAAASCDVLDGSDLSVLSPASMPPPSLHLRLQSEAQTVPPADSAVNVEELGACMEAGSPKPAWLQPSPPQQPADGAGERSRCSGDEEEAVVEEGATSSEDLSASSDSDTESDSEETEAEHSHRLAQELAMAKALLVDKEKRRHQFLEDEAEMSEDEGHSDDDDDDVDEDGILKDLIGAETERHGDSKRRAALHAQWLAAQDDAQVKHIMDGIQNGFRRRGHGPTSFMDDGQGEESEWDARRRRALLAGGGDAEAEEADEEGSQGSQPAAEESTSDVEDASDLQRYHQQRVLDASQDAVAAIALDAGSQEVLGLLTRCVPASGPPLPTKAQIARPGLGRDLTNQQLGSVSFLGRTSSQTAGTSARAASQHGGTRSFVFGRDDSNSALNARSAKPEENHPDCDAGATTFAGLSKLIKLPGKAKPHGNTKLLGMLGSDSQQGQQALAATMLDTSSVHAAIHMRLGSSTRRA